MNHLMLGLIKMNNGDYIMFRKMMDRPGVEEYHLGYVDGNRVEYATQKNAIPITEIIEGPVSHLYATSDFGKAQRAFIDYAQNM